jgi:hypothetical protein
MLFRFFYKLVSHWPPLAWIASCKAGSDSIHIIHGVGIEHRTEWFCEAVWDSTFAEGNLDQTDLVFGSGAHIRQDKVTFVSAGSTVDRLQFTVRGDCTFVSNSLPCLLESIDAQLDATFRGYDELFEQIIRGIDQKLPDLPIVGGLVQFTYHHNLSWDGAQLQIIPKPAPRRDFASFENYTSFLRTALLRIGENMSSQERKRPLAWLGTISRGYDSATSAALSREAGLRRVITLDESRPGMRDDGLAIAKALTLDCVVVNRLAWKNHPSLEPVFLAGDAQGKEIMIAGAPTGFDGVVLVTGQGGDTAWSNKSMPSDNLSRTGHAGLSMTEYRLHAGFIHLPVPFMGLRQRREMLKLSKSANMTAWDIGGSYSRPICRRVLEEAGVPRDMFGISKTGASVRFLRGEDSWSPAGKRALFKWLLIHRSDYGMPLRALLEVRCLLFGLEIVLLLSRHTPFLSSHFQNFMGRCFRFIARRLAWRIKRRGLNDLAFVWAIDTVRKSYRAS